MAVVAALWAGRLDAGLASALLGLIVSGYPTLRTWLKAQHVDAVADVLAAHIRQGGGAVALGALAGAVEGSEATNETATPQAIGKPSMAETAKRGNGDAASSPILRVPDSPIPSALPAALVLLGASLLLLTGCAQTPYYVSGINGSVDTSKDGSRLTGGGVNVTISPNPNYPLPKPNGLAK